MYFGNFLDFGDFAPWISSIYLYTAIHNYTCIDIRNYKASPKPEPNKPPFHQQKDRISQKGVFEQGVATHADKGEDQPKVVLPFFFGLWMFMMEYRLFYNMNLVSNDAAVHDFFLELGGSERAMAVRFRRATKGTKTGLIYLEKEWERIMTDERIPHGGWPYIHNI